MQDKLKSNLQDEETQAPLDIGPHQGKFSQENLENEDETDSNVNESNDNDNEQYTYDGESDLSNPENDTETI